VNFVHLVTTRDSPEAAQQAAERIDEANPLRWVEESAEYAPATQDKKGKG
jgi:hypothetical protein